MPDPLDYSRFPLPDFAPGEEQRLADRERAWSDMMMKVEVVTKLCEVLGFGSDAWTVLAYLSIEQVPWIDPRVRRVGMELLALKNEVRDAQ